MPSPGIIFQSLLFLPILTTALSLDCKHMVVDGVSFNLEKLGGPKTVHHLESKPPSIHNTTFSVDICDPLPKPKGSRKEDECPTGTRVCAKQEICKSGECTLDEVIPIAGEYTLSHGQGLEPKLTRLKDSDSNTDANQEGLRMELHGGEYEKVDQKAIIEFVCDRDLTGNEGFENATQVVQTRGFDVFEEPEDGEPELPNLDAGKSLEYLSYKSESDIGVLRLKWKTKYACEDAYDKKDPQDESSKGWGFFTWLLIIVFLLAAAYIIFGSWLNYNRYGARGWDLLPHGDMIRDIPYIVKDWALNLADRLKGNSSRGGYSAV